MRFVVTQYVVVQPTSDRLFLTGDRVLVNRWAQVGTLGDKTEYAAVQLTDSMGQLHVLIDQCVAGPGDSIWVSETFEVTRHTDADTARGVVIVLPEKGREVQVSPANAQLLALFLQNTEHRAVKLADGRLIEGGNVLESVVLHHDCYWFRDISMSQGFVSEDQVLGRVWCISYSVDRGYGLWPNFRSDRWFLRVGA